VSSVSTAGHRTRTPSAHAARVAQNRARFGRIALALVVLLMASSYVRPALDWVSARSTAGEQTQRLDALRATETELEHEKARLSTERGLTVEARRLGMVREGERAYVVRGLPKN
jgi:cell division protein FtsB